MRSGRRPQGDPKNGAFVLGPALKNAIEKAEAMKKGTDEEGMPYEGYGNVPQNSSFLF